MIFPYRIKVSSVIQTGGGKSKVNSEDLDTEARESEPIETAVVPLVNSSDSDSEEKQEIDNNRTVPSGKGEGKKRPSKQSPKASKKPRFHFRLVD